MILSGGSGTRLWPASRSMYPKQLLPLVTEATMLQETAARIRGIPGAADECLIVCNEAHRFLVSEQMEAIDTPASVILEPEGRNTAPAVALAAFAAAMDDENALLLVMPADHVIRDVQAFQAAVGAGVEAAAQGKLVTFGIVPTRPETGYGYVKAKPNGDAAVPVAAFVEKPDLPTAQRYVDGGEHFWNSGMFLFSAGAFLQELATYSPKIHEKVAKSAESLEKDLNFLRPDAKAFAESPSDSIDYAVMEKTSAAMMVPLDAGWSDVGSWQALAEVCGADAEGNSINGDVILHGCKDTFISAENRLVMGVGLDNIVVVETKDSVLVADKAKSQDVKHAVDELKAQARPETALHREVFRPWGSYDSLENAEGFQVKRLKVKPGAVLSLQKHAHRSEHWVCVKGKARITINDREFDLKVNESTYVAIGDVHRIANPYDEPAHIVEVQCGDYLGEDDIVRLEDNYGREGTNT
ncbi:MAG TPA: mannose-1-phosphate guanylyltransferase/mannose-6-phosphate isomerase [Vicinamibacterales bacterium]|nr:mannose-1-phosphate guanylyltransferase/mannose-6-phosphate isomerase [Vicinamibacterales bacterium]